MAGFRGDWRFYLADFLAIVPLGVVSLLGVYFYLNELPRLERQERELTVAQYRETAAKIKDGEAKGACELAVGERKFTNRLSKGAWGFEESGDKVLVWYHAPKAKMVRGVKIDAAAPSGLRTRFWILAALVGCGLLIASEIALRMFRRFSREREEFVFKTAHDLKTPVAALELLTAKADDETRSAVLRLRHLVRNLTDRMGLGSGSRVAVESVDLVKLWNEAESAYRTELEDAGVVIGRVGRSTLTGLGDADRVVQIFWNLIGNALKYAVPDGGGITVRFDGAGVGKVRVEVADTGRGMSAGERRRCFSCRYRSASARHSGKGGFGLGLSNSRELARRMGGELSVAPNVPHGCIFTLSLRR